jgi:hypothetical protein
MRTTKLFLLVILALYSSVTIAQPEREAKSLRVLLDNDFLNFRGAGTDRYYTNGVRIDYFFAKKRKAKFPSSILINISKDNNNVYGWGLAQFMFTPQDITLPEIQYEDRPYGGALYAIHSLQSIDTAKKTKITTELFLGVMGSISFAEESQTLVHQIINSPKPEGWDNQVSNDIIINYNITIEKQLLYPSKSILLVGLVETYSGTLYNAAGVGFMLRVGKFNNYFSGIYKSETSTKNKFQLYVFMKPIARVVIGNALLQGGLINQLTEGQEGYTLNKDQIERITVLYDVGLTFELPKFSVSFIQKMRTPEFKGSHSQEVGNITMQFRF